MSADPNLKTPLPHARVFTGDSTVSPPPPATAKVQGSLLPQAKPCLLALSKTYVVSAQEGVKLILLFIQKSPLTHVQGL